MRDKRKKFVELAEKRVNNALKQIELIGNLANRANYDYSEEDYQKVFRVIDAEVKAMKQKFTGSTDNERKKFALDD
jgi:hypothetical protein